MISKKKLLSAAVSMGTLAMIAPFTSAQVEEVLVTATKRAESIQDVPISISAYSDEFIEDSGITDLKELGAHAPNLNLSSSSQVANTRIAIRGVGSVGNNAVDPSVAVFIDGVYYPRPGAVVGQLQDIASVEVLRGPQGTLFGRNASMGALNISTKKPTQENSADLRLELGDYGQQTVGATFNGGLGGNTAGRISFQTSERDGWGESTFDGEEIGAWKDSGIRGALTFDIGEVEATLRADWKKIENNGLVIDVKPESVIPRYLGTLAVVLDQDLQTAELLGADAPDGELPDVEDAYDNIVHQKATDYAEDEQSGLSIDLQGSFGSHTWRSITSLRSWENFTYEDAIRLPSDLLPRVTDYATETWSQEFQLLSDTDGAFSYVTGAYFYHEEYDLAQQFHFGDDFCGTAAYNVVYTRAFPQAMAAILGQGADQATAIQGATNVATTQATQYAGLCGSFPSEAAIASTFTQKVDSLAVFAQGTYDFSDALSGTFGLRWTDDEKDGSFDMVLNNPVAGPSNPADNGGVLGLGLRVAESTDLSFDDSQLTWLANLQYQASDDMMFFYSLSTGYKAGGFNSDGGAVALGDRRIFDSEEVLSHELGMKSTLADTITLNATLYRTNIDNFQDRLFDGLSFVVVNAGELQQQGLEIDLTARPNEHFTAIVGLSLLDSEFLSYPNGTNLPGFDQTEAQDLKGTSNNFSPDKQLSATLEWRDEFASGMQWFVRGNYQYVGEQSVNGQTDNNPASIEDPYSLVNARLGIAAADESWSVSLYGKNLGDEGYCQISFYQPLASILGLVDSNTGNAMTRCVSSAPKQMGVEFKYSF